MPWIGIHARAFRLLGEGGTGMDAWGNSKEHRLSDRTGRGSGARTTSAFLEPAGRYACILFAAKTAEHHEVLRIENNPMTRRFLKLNRITHPAFPGAVAYGQAPYRAGR